MVAEHGHINLTLSSEESHLLTTGPSNVALGGTRLISNRMSADGGLVIELEVRSPCLCTPPSRRYPAACNLSGASGCKQLQHANSGRRRGAYICQKAAVHA